MNDCPCDPRLITQEWLHRQWHAANPGVRPTPWEAPRPSIVVESPLAEERPCPDLPQLPPPTQLRARRWTPYVLVGGRS
jgi:hypothetical protein